MTFSKPSMAHDVSFGYTDGFMYAHLARTLTRAWVERTRSFRSSSDDSIGGGGDSREAAVAGTLWGT